MNKSTPFYRKALVLATVALVVAMMVAPHAYAATESVTSSYGWGNANTYDNIISQHPTSAAANSAVAQTFNASVGGYLSTVTVPLYRIGAPTETVNARIEGCGGNLAADPNGTVYDTSYTPVVVADLDTVAYSNYTFDFGSDVLLTEGAYYALVIYSTSTTFADASNCARIGRDTTTPTAEGQYNYYSSSAWGGPISNNDFIYEIKVYDTLGGGSSGGLPTYEAGDYDTLITSLVSFIVPIFILMLPVILLIMITRSTDKWIILIGLTIGVGLGYFFGMVPLWLVFLVTIGLIGMAYQSVRGGG